MPTPRAPLPTSLAVAAARHGLPGAVPVAAPALPATTAGDRGAPGTAGWRAAVASLESQRLVGLARAVLSDLDVALAPDVERELVEAHHRLVFRDLTLEGELLSAVEEWGIDRSLARVLKGPAIARCDEPFAADRSFIDIDLLVHPDAIDGVVARAIAAGAARSYPEPRPGFDRRFGKGVNLVRPSGFAIDLHRSLALGAFGAAIDVDELHAGVAPLEIGGEQLAALDRPRRFLHACYHAALGARTPPLVALRDVVVTMPDDPDDLATALALAHRWRGEAVVAAGVRAAVRTLRLDVTGDARWAPVAAWVATARPDRRERRWLDAHGADRSTPLQTLYAIEGTSGAAARVAYAWAVLAPRDVGDAGGSRTRWRRALRAVRTRARPSRGTAPATTLPVPMRRSAR